MNNFSQVACYNAEDARGYTVSEVEKHRNSLDPYNTSENNYYRTWQLQQRAHKQSIQGTELPPPPYNPVSASNDVRDSRYVEHVYESPKFDRRDVSASESGDLTHAQYFELDPEAEDETYTLGRNRNHLRQQNLVPDREISWLPRGGMEISEVGPGPLPRWEYWQMSRGLDISDYKSVLYFFLLDSYTINQWLWSQLLNWSIDGSLDLTEMSNNLGLNLYLYIHRHGTGKQYVWVWGPHPHLWSPWRHLYCQYLYWWWRRKCNLQKLPILADLWIKLLNPFNIILFFL